MIIVGEQADLQRANQQHRYQQQKHHPHRWFNLGGLVKHAVGFHLGRALAFFLAENACHDQTDDDAKGNRQDQPGHRDIKTDGGARIGNCQDVDCRSYKQEGDGRTKPRAALPDAGEQRQDGAGTHCQDKTAKARPGS